MLTQIGRTRFTTRMLVKLKKKGNLGTLDEYEEQLMATCMNHMNEMDMVNARKVKFLSSFTSPKEPDYMSRVSFKRLSTKRSTDALAKIELYDGTILKNRVDIARECIQ